MILKTLSGIAAFAAALVVARAGFAQQPPAHPLDVVPDKMPFDTPYGPAISPERADAILAAALADAKKRDWKLICSVVDSGGALVSLKRMDGAQLASIAIAEHNVRAAATVRRETTLFENAVQNNIHYILSLDDVIASRGGIPLVDGGKLIGAIGCSGGTSSQDEVVAKAGVAALK